MSITLFTTAGTVELKEEYEGYAKGRAIDRGPYVIKPYSLEDWTKIDYAIDALMGTTTTTGGIGGTIIRIAPHQCPENPKLYCIDAYTPTLAPNDTRDGGRPSFNKATILATYGVLPYNVNTFDDPGAIMSFPNDSTPSDPYTYAIMEVKTDLEAIVLPNTAYKFASDNKKSNAKHIKYIARADLIYTRKRVPFLNLTLYLSKLNKLNNATFLGIAAGQVRFANFSTRIEMLDDGTKANEVTFVFKWREQHWNKYHRDDSNTFDTLVDGSSNNPYSSADLSPLLSQ